MAPMTEEQLKLIEEQTKRAIEISLSRYTRRVQAIFFILLGVSILALFLNSRATALNACKRVNVLRAQSNVSDTVSFKILTISGQREALLAKQDKPATRAAHGKSARLLLGQAQQLTITPLTDCGPATRLFTRYSYPKAGPIGNPITGQLTARSKASLVASLKLIKADQGR